MKEKEFIEKEIDNMKHDLALLVSHKSIYSEDAKPFGKENIAVLNDALNLFTKYGLKSTNLDNYCGYGEIGDGDKTIGIVGHLDVVPAPLDGWDSDPFNMIEKDGILYGRGVSDDKGGVIASLYALKYLISTNYHFKKKVRLIVGCNEESGSRCMQYYVEKRGQDIDLGFTPDANFPGIFAEKGMCPGKVINTKSKIINIKGGEASNIVAKKVEAELPLNSFDEVLFDSFMKEHHIEYNFKKNNNIYLNVEGKASHGSLPDKGINAINYLMEGLYIAGFNDKLTDFWHQYIGLGVHGEKLGLDKLKDEYTDMTFSVGMIYKEENRIIFTIDARFPVTRKVDDVLPLMNKMCNNHTVFVCEHTIEPLFFDLNSKMIKALTSAYAEVTHDYKSKMQAIGGGTYAKSIKGIVAFGCCFDGEDGNIHSPNEYLYVESLKKQVLCYIQAIKNLNELEV